MGLVGVRVSIGSRVRVNLGGSFRVRVGFWLGPGTQLGPFFHRERQSTHSSDIE